MKPLLTLCMMVKDEAHGIARTLQSVRPWIDRWCILDTGSTDGTPEVVQRELEGVEGVAMEGAFVDFATTRNRLLDMAAHFLAGGGFLLLLDADDVLGGGEALRAWLREAAEEDPSRGDREAFYVRMSEGGCEWSSARVVRASAVGAPRVSCWKGEEPCAYRCEGQAAGRCVVQGTGWHYVCPVHEVLVHPSARVPTITIPGVRIRHERPPQSAEKLRARLDRDVRLLAAEVEKDPINARAVFYLAQTFKRMGKAWDARKWFHRRVELGGWREEVFESMLEAARLQVRPRERTREFLDAWAFAPHRAEPLEALALDALRAVDTEGKPAPRAHEAFLFARRAAELSYPEGDTLFVDGELYRWRALAILGWAAWHVGERKIGHEATRAAWVRVPVSETAWREAIENNLVQYERKAAR